MTSRGDARRRPRRLQRLVLFVVSGILFASAAAQAGRLLVVSRDLSQPQAFVVLGSHEWERLPAAATLATRNRDAVVLLTQPLHPTPQNCHRCDERVSWLAHLGVSGERVAFLPTRVSNTYDEARAALEYSRAHAIGRLTVVTSPYHTRRALATFTLVFEPTDIAIGVVPASTESRAVPDRWWWHGYDRAYVRYEWIALAWYAIRHGVAPFSGASNTVGHAPDPVIDLLGVANAEVSVG